MADPLLHEHVLSPAEEQAVRASQRNSVIGTILSVLNVLLLLRIVFRLLAARSTGFAGALYSLTDPLVRPFQGIFPALPAAAPGLDTAALVAILVYSLLAWLAAALLDLAFRPSLS